MQSCVNAELPVHFSVASLTSIRFLLYVSTMKTQNKPTLPQQSSNSIIRTKYKSPSILVTNQTEKFEI